ncbi:MAG: hypothetical protein U0X20_27685 [Caldilineaceae bacterium]
MRFWDKVQTIFGSWDLWLALSITVVLMIYVPREIPAKFAQEVFGVTIALLAIVFSVYFAALAILLASGDNDFIRFMTEDGSYYSILWAFKVTVILLFAALLASIALFSYAAYVEVLYTNPNQNTVAVVPGWCIVTVAGLALYALFASVSSSVDAIRSAELRARYIEISGPSKRDQN